MRSRSGEGTTTSFRYAGWTGVDNSNNDMNVDVAKMSDCRNLLFTTFGDFFVRKGLMLPNALVGDAILIIYDIYHNQMLYQANVNGVMGLYLYVEGDEDQLLQKINTTESLAWAHCDADRKVYFTSEVDRLFSWDGNATSILKGDGVTEYTEVYGKVVTWYQNHMFLAGSTRFGSGSVDETKIFISNLGDPTTWDNNDWLPASGNGNVVGMIELGEHVLVILKSLSIVFVTGYGLNSWRLTEDNDATTNIDNSVGCAGRQAYCRVANEVWFMDNQKNIRVIYQTDYDPYRKTYRSEDINAWTDEISNSLFSRTQMLYFDDKVWIFAPDLTGGKKIVLVFDILAARRAKLKSDLTMGESWTRFEGDYWDITGACVRYVGGLPTLMLVNHNWMMVYGGATDDMGDGPKPIIAYGMTKNDDLGRYDYVKNFKLFFGNARIQNNIDKVGVWVSIDDEVEGFVGNLEPSNKGMILRDDDETIGNATLDAADLGIYNEKTDDDVLGYYQPKKTKLRYDNIPYSTVGTVIKHIFRISATGEIRVSKIGCDLQLKNVR